MSYIKPFLRMQVLGSLYDSEEFSFGINFIGPIGSAIPTAVPAGIFTALEQFFGVSRLVSVHAEITRVKLNHIGTDGKYTQPTTVEDEPVLPIIGNSTATPAPQVALAVSLLTNVKRGRAHAGRFYTPLPGVTLDTGGRFSGSDALEFATQAVIMLNAFNASLTGWQVGIVSNLGSGYEQPVTHVRVGRVLDTIRSRRTSLDEDYQTSALAVVDA